MRFKEQTYMSRTQHQVPTEPVAPGNDPIPDQEPEPGETPVPDPNPVTQARRRPA